MAKNKEQKAQEMQELATGLKSAKSVVFANFQGLKVKDSEELRGICRAQNVGYMASKKTILKKALDSIGFNINADEFPGGVSIVLGVEDDIAPAQIIANFAKKNDIVKIYGGILEGAFIDDVKVNELAKLPSKQQLLGQLVGTLNAPVSGFVNVLAGNLRNLVNVLNNLKEAKA